MRIRPAPVLAAAAVPVITAATAAFTSVRMIKDLSARTQGAPDLPGERRCVPFGDGAVAYRYHRGDPTLTPLVFLHGWGQCADATWFTVLPFVDHPFVAVDLPGHGGSELDGEFSFESAARSVLAALDDAGLRDPVLVAHSMGGAVALSAAHLAPGRFSGILAVATTGFWRTPKLSMVVSLAPVVVSNRSPLLVRNLRRGIEAMPEHAESILWAWRQRPDRSVLSGSASALRAFDARAWEDPTLPPVTWVVPLQDQIIDPQVQMRSAEHFASEVVLLEDAGHSFFLHEPDRLLDLLPLQPW